MSILYNKSNLKYLIAATGLVILLKLDSNRWFFSPCDLQIWWMPSKKYKAPLLHYIKLCASSQTPRWIQAGVTVWKRSKSAIFLFRVTFKFDGWPWKTIGHLFLCYIKLCASFQSHRWIQTGVTVRKHSIQVKIDNFCPVWPWNLTDDLEKQ